MFSPITEMIILKISRIYTMRRKDCWRLSPAYDLTYSNTYYGEHTTTVDGNGRNPGEKEILAVGVSAGMEKAECKRIMNQIADCVKQISGKYLS